MGFFAIHSGHWYLAKRLLYMVVGAYGYIGLNIRNRMVIRESPFERSTRTECIVCEQPSDLFSRCDGHAACHVRGPLADVRLFGISYIPPHPRSRVYFVAAEETMKRGGLLPKLFALGAQLPSPEPGAAKAKR